MLCASTYCCQTGFDPFVGWVVNATWVLLEYPVGKEAVF